MIVTGCGRVALVTGGTRGLGRAMTERLAERGIAVAAAFSRDEQTATALRDDHVGGGVPVTVHRADVSDPDACRRLVEDVLARHGRLDYLVNNAGMLVERRPRDLGVEDWQRHLAVNLSSAFYLSQAALEHMVGRGSGRIVNIGSITALMGSTVQIPYAAAKSGLIGLTRSTARAVARKGITVNCVIPGCFDTEMTHSLSFTDRDALTPTIPLGRWGRPEELAHAVVFLLDDMSSYVTGAVLTVDGGMSMGG